MFVGYNPINYTYIFHKPVILRSLRLSFAQNSRGRFRAMELTFCFDTGPRVTSQYLGGEDFVWAWFEGKM